MWTNCEIGGYNAGCPALGVHKRYRMIKGYGISDEQCRVTVLDSTIEIRHCWKDCINVDVTLSSVDDTVVIINVTDIVPIDITQFVKVKKADADVMSAFWLGVGITGTTVGCVAIVSILLYCRCKYMPGSLLGRFFHTTANFERAEMRTMLDSMHGHIRELQAVNNLQQDDRILHDV